MKVKLCQTHYESSLWIHQSKLNLCYTKFSEAMQRGVAKYQGIRIEQESIASSAPHNGVKSRQGN